MSKINAVRFININYNNNAIRINDETLNFNGESTLISLQNGGGKSVLVQMMTAPFVHKKYRNVADRPFDNYFTTAKPSFILIEWLLDGGAGKMMNGFMVRKNQEESEERQELLDIMGIISEYQEPCMWDIHNLPVVEKTKKEMILKGYAACRQLFEGYKKDREAKFFCYDMNSAGQQRQYFEKLKDYHVDCKEWETIIKKVNEKEGGLADLFADCKDERGLLEKWFLPSIEAKLDKEGSRIRGFERDAEQHIRQYYESEDKIKRRDNIRKFKEQVVSAGDAFVQDDSRAEIKNGDMNRTSNASRPATANGSHPATVKELAEAFVEREEEKARQESRIALFRDRVAELRTETTEQIRTLLQELQECKEKIIRTRYEKYSYELLKLSEEQKEYEAVYQRLKEEIEALEQAVQETEEQIGILSCRKYYEKYKQEKREYDKVLEQLKAEQAKGEDTKPRREELGGLLFQYYTEQLQKTEGKLQECQEKSRERNEAIKKAKALFREAAEEAEKKSALLGSLGSLIQMYDDKESDYNQRYDGELARNILGTYEEGMLPVEQEHVKALQLKQEKELRRLKEKKVETESQIVKNGRELNAAKTSRMETGYKKDAAEKELLTFGQEIEARKTILRYVELKENALFDTDLILQKLESKITEVEAVLLKLKEQEKALKKEYDAIAQGRIYELPESIREALKSIGLEEPYGLRWLRSNGKSVEENIELVRRNPFLPYALILTPGEYKKLQDMDDTLYSEIPIPIILRNDLECGDYKTVGGTLELGRIKFYIRFHESLLDENQFAQILREKEAELLRISEKTAIREKEKNEHVERLGIIRNQRLTKEAYEEAQQMAEYCEAELLRYSEEIEEYEKQEIRLKEELGSLEEELRVGEQQQIILAERLKQLEALTRAYAEYLEQKKSEKRVKEELQRLSDRKSELMEEQEKQWEELQELEGRRNDLLRDLQAVEASLKRYRQYEEKAANRPIEDIDYKRMEKYEAEYLALSEQVDRDIQRLEEELDRQQDRLSNVSKDLNEQKKVCLKESGMEEEAFNGLIESARYSRDEEERLTGRKKELEKNRKETEKQLHEADKKIALQKKAIEVKTSEMKKETGEELPLSKEEIIPREYDSEIALLQFGQEERQKNKEELENKKQGLDAVLSGLAEYEEFRAEEGAVLEENLSLFSKQELDQRKGILTRDYNALKDAIQRARNRLDGRVRDVLAIPEFGEDYYRKPLEAMLSLVDRPSELLRQIQTTVQAYDDLMKKIEVDLSLIEKERTNIIGELMEYVKAVHQDLAKIDDNSSISVRERTLKMLEIKLPNWQEQEDMYQVRIRDFMEQLTKHGVELYKKNENAQEYFGTQMNTRVLYDTVVGLVNVQIRLYKIEKQREYPITWAEVAKNSGGEGFLSTFVILSGLLHYMRKDDNDIFAERNESKVLLMDNPFGLTYSEHLLKPLMEMAKKNHTQLICLSGLGGDSIYGRFDNIYILNLVTASLKNGTQFLRTEHYRGTDPETIIASQFEVMEQLTLF